MRSPPRTIGPKILGAISIVGGLIVACSTGEFPPFRLCNALLSISLDFASDTDGRIEKREGQNVINSLSVHDVGVPTFHTDLSHYFVELFPRVILALRSRFAILQQSTLRCFSNMCDVLSSATSSSSTCP